MLTALALADEFDVVLHDPRPRRAPNGLEIVGFGFSEILASLGLTQLWETLDSRQLLPGVRSAWPGQGNVPWADAFRPSGVRYAIDRRSLEGALHNHVDMRPRIRRSAKPLESDSAFLVDATGRASAVARRMGARSRAIADLVGHVGYGEARNLSTPIVEPIESGWWFASAGGNAATAILFTQGKLLAGRETWMEALMAAPLVHHHFKPDALAPASSIPASSRYLHPCCGGNWAAVGDAALTRDPLSSDGLGFTARSAVLMRSCLTTDGFDAGMFDRQISLEVARYRIARHRYYSLTADRFGGAFWTRQAQLSAKAGQLLA